MATFNFLNPFSAGDTFRALDQQQANLEANLPREIRRMDVEHAQLKQGVSDITAENLTEPLREAFETQAEEFRKMALAESEIASRELQAVRANNPDTRAGARLSQREQVRTNLRRSLNEASASSILNYGQALTQALQSGSQLELQARSQVNASAQNQASIVADFLKTQNAFALGSAQLKLSQLKKATGLSAGKSGGGGQRAEDKDPYYKVPFKTAVGSSYDTGTRYIDKRTGRTVSSYKTGTSPLDPRRGSITGQGLNA